MNINESFLLNPLHAFPLHSGIGFCVVGVNKPGGLHWRGAISPCQGEVPPSLMGVAALTHAFAESGNLWG